MNKTEFVKAVAAEGGEPAASTAKTVNAVLKVIADSMAKGEKIVLPGFGTFLVAERAARTGHNPATGAKIKIAAKRVVKFRPSNAIQPGKTAAPKAGRKK